MTPRLVKPALLAGLLVLAGGGPAAIALASTPHGRAGAASSSSSGGLDVLPFPGTPDATPSTNIDLPSVVPSQIEAITAIGSRSGPHTGRISAQPAGHGSAFSPARPFSPGEQVTVTATLQAKRLRWSFSVARFAPTPANRAQDSAGASAHRSSPGTHSFISAPDLHPPVVTMSGRDTDTSSGNIFLDAQNSGQSAAYFTSARGNLRWYQPSATSGAGPSVFDVRVQSLNSQPVITYWKGHVVPPGVGKGVGLILNGHYQTIHTVTAGGGYANQGIDLHEFTLGRDGSEPVAFVPIWSQVSGVDLRSVGGPANGVAIDWIIQEIDVATNRLMWEWHSLGHIPISDTYAKYAPGQPFDYFHLNSIQQLSNGHIIISARNTWTVYSVNRSTGKIDWRLGGKHSSFKLGGGTRFYWQHHATLHSGGLLTVFDDGAPPPEEKQSRALEIHIGTNSHQASLVRSDTHNPSTLAYSQGAVELLTNHNLFVGWGSRPYFSEYTPSGSQIFSGSFQKPIQSYRAYRFDNWVGDPLRAPAVAVRRRSANHYNVYASWNGSTRVAKWEVMGSSSQRGKFRRVASRGFVGFETRIGVNTGDTWFKVVALDGHGRALPHGTSAAVKP